MKSLVTAGDAADEDETLNLVLFFAPNFIQRFKFLFSPTNIV